jgi:hypothetical protein
MKRFAVVILVGLALVVLLAVPAFAATGSAHFYSGNDSATVYGPLYEYKAPGDVAWGSGVPAVLAWKHGAWPLIAGSDAAYISNTYLVGGNIAASQWRWFRITLPIPANAVNIAVTGGAMKVNSDNADRTWLNGTPIGTDGEVEDPWADNHEWNTIQTYSIPPGVLAAGNNYMDVVVRNYPGSSDPYQNPTGFIYDFSANYTYDLTVLVDIKPGSDPSSVNWNGKGTVPVAIFGSAIFDVAEIDPASVKMEGAAIAFKGKKDPTAQASIEDVNGDGFMDLVVHIADMDGNINSGMTTAKVDGLLYDGTYFSGMGDIKVVK